MELREVRGRDGEDADPFNKLRADSSTPLRFAQDDRSSSEMGTEANFVTPSPFAMELREVAVRMTHLYWYWLGSPFADDVSSNRMASLLYVDTN